MSLPLPAHHDAIVSNAYYGAFACICLCELIAARRSLTMPMHARWLVNIGLAVTNTVMSRGLFPLLGVAVAVSLEKRGIGLFNAGPAPDVVAVPISLLTLDLTYYAWHRLEHRIPLLWRFHLIHHCDVDVDLTTELRHHPVEAFFSAAVFLPTAAILGAPPFAVFLFVLLESVAGLWQHANIRIPAVADRVLRWVLVTPDMHRIHHSADRPETDSNYTMLFSFWDRLFGTYRATPGKPHEDMMLGLDHLREHSDQRLGRILLHPFRRPAPADIRN